MGSEGSIIALINKGNKQKCIISNIEFFESEMINIGHNKWIAKKYFKEKIRPDYPGLSSKRRGNGWFKAN